MSVQENTESVETTDIDQQAVDETAAEQESTAPTPGKSGIFARTRGFVTARWKGLALTVMLLAAAGFAGALYLTSFRPSQLTDAASEQAAVDAASSSTLALLSYSPETLDRDMERAKTLTTGEFQTYYTKFTAEVVAPAVRERGIMAGAQVLNAAVMEIQPDNAKVLLFLNQETASKDRPEPSLATSSVVVSITKTDGDWRISALDPV
ncbi:hypothetical protein [Arthrobacter sp. SLBN-53]|uniref:hypothetical protein n=1 Tax=Arthrobacter sp. SLBN-53 TaxID=2768412 RepID=UPI00116C4182|nr:hypothetical protein [Arthrobacter sp. SLBN-53]TQK27316.1 Mce-associated membrane protein [Arthrobacter sp. SLBN-53]